MKLHIFALLIGLLANVALTANENSQNCNLEISFRADCERLLVEKIKNAKKEILVAAYSFNRRSIATALIDQHRAGVIVKIKLDRRQSMSNHAKSTTKRLKGAGIDIELISMPSYHHMHNKFVVVDRSEVLTGSYNFTTAASRENWENLICISDAVAATEFANEFNTIESRSTRRSER